MNELSETTVVVVKELPVSASGTTQVVVRRGERHYVVSSVHAYSGFETLVFGGEADGEITNWLEIAGGRGMSRDAAIADLAALSDDEITRYWKDDE